MELATQRHRDLDLPRPEAWPSFATATQGNYCDFLPKRLPFQWLSFLSSIHHVTGGKRFVWHQRPEQPQCLKIHTASETLKHLPGLLGAICC